jgi:hypothetical protein
MSTAKRLLGSVLLVALALGCGEPDDGQDDVAADPDGEAYLTVDVRVRPDPDAEEQALRYVCDADGSSLSDDDADEACQALLTEEEWLREGFPSDLVCTQEYGGPEVAELEGTLDGESFTRELDRTDGCRIDMWERLSPALGEPGAGPPA